MSDTFDVTTIIFAALALFVVWKLRSVLGTRTGHERRPDAPPRPNGAAGAPSDDGKVVRLPGAANDRRAPGQALRQNNEARWDGLAERGSAVWQGLDSAVAEDPSFEPGEFLEGAKAAYEMIIGAFASGDRQTLNQLLARDVYESFEQAIAEREKAGHKVETTFVSMDAVKIDDAQLRGRSIQITVAFASKLITATYDPANKVVDGNPEKVSDVADVWTFARDAGSNDPNWKLIAT
ncbi:MAG: Tim44 domain-containing protein [Alphaproteobacteria bacterium]|nr:Tim44 domain-containing protein [Alphaproteobacteria bacterium]